VILTLLVNYEVLHKSFMTRLLLALFMAGALPAAIIAQEKPPVAKDNGALTPQEKKIATQIKHLSAYLFSEELDRAFALAKENLKLDVSPRAVALAATYSPNAEIRKEANTLMVKELKDTEAMSKYCRWLSRSRNPEAIDVLRGILKDVKVAKTKRFTASSLADQLVRKADKSASLTPKEKTALKDEALGLYKKVIADLDTDKNPDLKKFASLANGRIFALENLRVGMVAPEIEGTDHDGKTFKLSDYRGKVTLINFWGIW